jgi:hypothetical protein
MVRLQVSGADLLRVIVRESAGMVLVPPGALVMVHVAARTFVMLKSPGPGTPPEASSRIRKRWENRPDR